MLNGEELTEPSRGVEGQPGMPEAAERELVSVATAYRYWGPGSPRKTSTASPMHWDWSSAPRS